MRSILSLLITITSSSGLSKDEIERMKQDAQAHASEDKAKKEKIEVKNQADSIVYSTEKMMKDNADKVPAEVKAELTTKVEELKKIKDSDDIDAIKKKIEEINQVAMKAGEAMYKAGQQSAPNPNEQKKDDKAQDANFNEKK